MLRVLSCPFFFMKIRMKRCVDVKREYIKGETKSNDLFSFNKIALCHQFCYLIATPRIPYASFNHKQAFKVLYSKHADYLQQFFESFCDLMLYSINI